MSYAKIMPRRGTLYEWMTVNPILYEGELGVEIPETGVGTGLCKFKIGDGHTPYERLPYAFDASSANSINGGDSTSFHVIQIRSDTTENWENLDPVLEENEITFDIDMNAFKMGDGVSHWHELDYTGISFDYDFGDEDNDVAAAAVSGPKVLSIGGTNKGATIQDLLDRSSTYTGAIDAKAIENTFGEETEDTTPVEGEPYQFNDPEQEEQQIIGPAEEESVKAEDEEV